MDLLAELRSIVQILNEQALEYAVCGGIAVTVHGAPRTTKDIDVLVREEDVPRVLALVARSGFDLPARPMVFERGGPRERRVQRVSKASGADLLTLDLLVATPVLAPALEGRVRVRWGDMDLWLVSLDGLALMKRLAGRLQDLADLERLGFGHE